MITQMVQISPKAKRIYLQRFLLSKFCYFKEELELRDLCCLFENQLWLEQKCLTDPDFATKFSKNLESLSIILKRINFRQEISARAINRFSLKLQRNLEDLILPKRNYKEAKKRCNGLYSLKDSTSLGISSKRIPPKAYIGIGYRDKGSARDVAKDGSPSWQEVATHRGPLYHKGKRYEQQNEASKATQILEKLQELGREKSSKS